MSALTEQLLAEIRSVDPGDWCAGPWTQDPVEGAEDEGGHFVVKDADGTAVATLPQWAGSLALFIAVARDGMPALVAEVERLTAQVAELEKDSATLAALEAAGVDSWEGYSNALAGESR